VIGFDVRFEQPFEHHGDVRARVSLALLAFLSVLVMGCGANQPSSTPAGLGGGGGQGELCPDLSLRSPSGERLALTGTWFADDFGDYFITQRASCLHWLGMSPALAGAAAGEWWTNVYVGQIESDFSVHGEWADVPYLTDYSNFEPNSGEIVLRIGIFEDESGVEWPALHMVEVRDSRGGYGGANWAPSQAMPPHAEYVGAYRYEDGCPVLEVGGQRYELVLAQYWVADQGQILDDDAYVVARPDDEVRIDGQIWPDSDTSLTCSSLPNRLLAWGLQVD
jgi:hypothetical protein